MNRLTCGVVAAGILGASAAHAADPSEGTIGSSAPKTTWSGELQGSGVFYNAWANDPTLDCAAPACDPFALTIADGPHPVTIKLNFDSTNVDGSDTGAGIRVKFPDGSFQYTQGSASATNAMTLKLKNAVPGAYEVNVVASHVCCGTDPYVASAEVTGLPAATPPAAVTPPPTPAPAPVPQLTVKAGKASAKKLARTRKLTLTASSTAPLSNVTASLRKGRKSVGSARLARLEGTARLVLKLKGKLRKGAYTATVSGTDAQGRTVTTGIRVKVAK